MATLKHRSGKRVFTPGGKWSTSCDLTAVVEFSGMSNCNVQGGCPTSLIEGGTYVVPLVYDSGTGNYSGQIIEPLSPHCLLDSGMGPFDGVDEVQVDILIYAGGTAIFLEGRGLFTGVSGGRIFFSRNGHGCSPSPCSAGMQTLSNSITSCANYNGEVVLHHSGSAEVTLI